MTTINLTYQQSCPNCGGTIDSVRLERGLPCEKCLPHTVDYSEVCQYLENGDMDSFCKTNEMTSRFEKFFFENLKSPLRNIQRMWARRFFLDTSFALLAPTGIGKTTFGMMLAAFLAGQGRKVYLLFPTQLIVNQVFERLNSLMGKKIRILAYSPEIFRTNVQKQQSKQRIKDGDFDILITTTMFLYKNADIVPRGIYSLVFVDDVDSVLKSARNIDKLLQLLGFGQDDLSLAMEFARISREYFQNPQDAKLQEKYEHLVAELERIKAKRRGNLIVSSATANPRSSRLKLFSLLLGFEAGRPGIALRKVADVYEKVEPEKLWDKTIQVVRKLGKGGLVFLPTDQTTEQLEEFTRFLNDNGISAEKYDRFDKVKDDFIQGKVQVITGFASYRNPLARGIDLPQTIRYAVFVGVPKLIFSVNPEQPSSLYYFLLMLRSFLVRKNLVDERGAFLLKQYVGYLERIKFVPADKLLPQVREKLKDIAAYLQELLKAPEISRAIEQSEDITVIREHEQLKIVTADITGYIQASGRTSRLFAGGLTQGLAYMLVDDKKAFYSLRKKAAQFYEGVEFVPASSVDLDEILRSIDKDRQAVRCLLSVDLTAASDSTTTATVVVESPNKARTIATFFGKPLRRRIAGLEVYEVATDDMIVNIVATKGHLFDLTKGEGYYGVNFEHGQFVPVFEPIDASRREIIAGLRRIAAETGQVFIATDPDTEGEKIAYDVLLMLRPFQPHIVRAEFHEVSRRAFVAAVKSPRQISLPLVKAQLVRRVSDRWVGFKISQLLQQRFNNKTLSAGRVQTPVLGWIIERDSQAQTIIYVFGIKLNGMDIEFRDTDRQKITRLYFDTKSVKVEITGSEEKQLIMRPFSTDVLLSEAASKLGFSPQKTMQLAQELFENGYITYHRTDSIRVSPEGINVARTYIEENFGKELLWPRTFQSSGGAHECIRPVRPVDAEELHTHLELSGNNRLSDGHLRLYGLIFRRFIASQMRAVTVLENTARVSVADRTTDVSYLRKILQDGYNLIIPVKTYAIDSGSYPVLYKYTKKSRAATHHTYASIVSEMKKRGIGRPSTYAITVQKLLDRKYVVEKNGYLIPTALGKKVYAQLSEDKTHGRFVSEVFTRELEEKMDKVEGNQADWQELLSELFEQLKPGSTNKQTL